MSDFGANIYDGRNPEPPAPRRRDAERPPAQKPAQPEVVQEVALAKPNRFREDADELVFVDAPKKAPPAPTRKAPAQPAATEPAIQPEPAPTPPPAPPAPPEAPQPTERRHAPADESRPAAHRPFPPRDERRRHEARDERPEQQEPPTNRPPMPPREPREAREPREPREAPPQAQRPRPEAQRERPMPPSPPPAAAPGPREPRDRPAPQGQRPHPAPAGVGLVIDLAALTADARSQGGELSLHKVRSALARDRQVAGAVCFGKPGEAAPSGFDLRVAEDSLAGGLALAAAALELLAGGSTLVVAPPTPALQQLAAALRKAGHRVEFAGFGDSTAGSVRRLGRECLFVP